MVSVAEARNVVGGTAMTVVDGWGEDGITFLEVWPMELEIPPMVEDFDKDPPEPPARFPKSMLMSNPAHQLTPNPNGD